MARTLPISIAVRPVAFNQDIKAILPNEEVDSEYLAWAIRAQEQAILRDGVKKGATVHSVRSGFIESLSIALPPLDQQRLIANRLNDEFRILEQARAAAEAQLAAVRKLAAALLRSAFSGEL